MRTKLLTLIFAIIFSSISAFAETDKEKFARYKAQAEAGDAEAMNELGWCFQKGIGTKQDESKAFYWYKKSAEGGNTDGMSNLGWCYRKKIGTVIDSSKAFYWFKKSAEGGNYNGMKHLGFCYDGGEGTAKDESKAFYWYKKSAEGGNIGGMSMLGFCYCHAKGTAQDLNKAFYWSKKSAEGGVLLGMCNLAVFYENGLGVKKNQAMADYWEAKSDGENPKKPKEWKAAEREFQEIAQRLGYASGSSYASKSPKNADGFDASRPPMVDIVAGSVAFVDKDGNKTINAGEACEVRFKVTNSGKGDANNCTAKATISGNSMGITANTTSISTIKPGETIDVAIPINAAMTVTDGAADIAVSVDEPHGFGSAPTMLAVNVKAFEVPRVLVADYSITSQSGGTQLTKRVPFDLQVLVQNMSAGEASDVKVNISVPNNVFIMEGDAQANIGSLNSGATKEMNYSLIVNNNYASTTVPVTITLKERYGKYAESRTINLNLNQALAANKIVVKGNASTAPKGNYSLAQIEGKQQQAEVDVNIPVSGAKSVNTFAIIIANENYRNEVKVEFARNDGAVLKEYLEKTMGLPSDNIHIAGDAGYNDMRRELNWLRQVSKAYRGDVNLIVYYAGHGMPEENGVGSYLIPVDGISSMPETCVSLSKFYSDLSAMGAKSVTVLMDACFSGAQRGSGMLASARGVAIKAKAAAPIAGNMLVLTAAQGDETAWPYREKGHGMFTYYLLKKLQDTKGETTWGELSQYVTDEVSRRSVVVNSKSQTPRALCSPDFSDRWQQLPLIAH